MRLCTHLAFSGGAIRHASFATLRGVLKSLLEKEELLIRCENKAAIADGAGQIEIVEFRTIRRSCRVGCGHGVCSSGHWPIGRNPDSGATAVFVMPGSQAGGSLKGSDPSALVRSDSCDGVRRTTSLERWSLSRQVGTRIYPRFPQAVTSPEGQIQAVGTSGRDVFSGIDDSARNSITREFGHGAHAELIHQSVAVKFDRLGRDVQEN